jgi:hypothetical protein
LVTWLKAYERSQEPQAANRENIKGLIEMIELILLFCLDYRALQDDYYKVVDVTSELIDCVSLAIA